MLLSITGMQTGSGGEETFVSSTNSQHVAEAFGVLCSTSGVSRGAAGRGLGAGYHSQGVDTLERGDQNC